LRLSPLTLKMLRRFRSIRRGYYSLLVLCLLVLLAVFGRFLVSHRAIAVKYDGRLCFPSYGRFHPGTDFGLDYDYETDYRDLQRRFRRANEGNWVVMPLIPFNGTEVVETQNRLVLQDGKYHDPRSLEPYRDGKAYTLHENGRRKRVWTVKNGVLHGGMRGYDEDGNLVEKGRWRNGQPETYVQLREDLPAEWTGDPGIKELSFQRTFPAPPGVGGHILGTDEAGRDVAARLFGGWRTVVLASMIYISLTYLIGISIGCAMGYFGGPLDLFLQRFIEIWSNIPFLYVVIILAAVITPNLYSLMIIIILFSWIGLTYYMRTATYREKEKEYAQAARLLGAGNARIIFRHILPNTISIVVTFVPFSVAAIIGSLTALDFLGFGLPPTEPTWGELLKQGTEHFESPWILMSVFASLVTVLVLVTFVGEAIREAFDPKKYAVYK